ncbi:MAG: prephenate dehydrogenase [Microbacteriaceae bacterium]
MNPVRLSGSVRIVGAGLLGTSIGLALSKLGVDTILEDLSPANQRLAIDYGAGRAPQAGDNPEIIVVCVPPDVTAKSVARELTDYPNAVVTDVASVKAQILNDLVAVGADVTRYVGSHPMAGRERGGALSGRADLFFTRPWVIAGHDSSTAHALAEVEKLALDLGAVPTRLDAMTHDRAVALVSHLPQIISTLLAARLSGADASDVALAGQGLRDTTRIAASDPALWVQILGANVNEVLPLLESYALDLEQLIGALTKLEQPGSLSVIGDALKRGNRGVELIPGKHGSQQKNYARIVVMLDDKPGQLAKLFTEIGEIGVNIEDLALEHSPGAQVGLAEIFVLPEAELHLINALTERSWRIAG